METFFQKASIVAFTAMGAVLGAALIGGLGAALVGHPPVQTMTRLAQEIKIWAIAAAIGGTFSMFEILEYGLFRGEVHVLLRQFFIIAAGFAGAQVGYFLILTLVGGKQ